MLITLGSQIFYPYRVIVIVDRLFNMLKYGAFYSQDKCHFTLWAPEKRSMLLHVVFPDDRKIAMSKDENGYFEVEVPALKPGSRYYYMPDEENDFPDPASFFQPAGVHGPSEVIDHKAYEWKDLSWHGQLLKDCVFYEIHVGTFTKAGTFEAIIPLLSDIASIGINAIELMPVCQFPGNRNWGYDGVYPFAVQDSYGGPEGLKKLVDACHSFHIAVFLDIVFNHLGIEGNYLDKFGPYFTQKYCIPWGEAINFDGEWSDGVREYFSDNTIYWFENFHIDGLRLDAIHMVFDSGAVNFWELIQIKREIAQVRNGRRFYLIAESDLNSPKVVKPVEMGGYGFDAQWLDDFHHASYVLLHNDGKSRYEDFGLMEQLAKAYKEGFVHSGEYVSFRKRKHGVSSAGIPGDKFIAFNLNHDQVGNRVKGERLSTLVDFESQKLAAALLLLAPYIPLLFMGEEYGEESPFFYFISHSDQKLIESVRKGRMKEFENFKWQSEPPDPQSEDTYKNSILHWEKRKGGHNKILLAWHKELISFRRSHPALQNFNKNDIEIFMTDQTGFMMHRRSEDEKHHLIGYFNFSNQKVKYNLPTYSEHWTKVIDSLEPKWMPYDRNPSLSEKQESLKDMKGSQIYVYPCSVVAYKNEIPSP